MRVSAVAKSVVALVFAVATALTAVISDDTVTSTEAVQVVLAALASLGVYIVPNSE